MPNVTQVITIGRNCGNMPMPSDEWRRFKLAVLAALTASNANVIQRPLIDDIGTTAQVGSWGGVVSEDAATFVALTPEAYAFTARNKLKAIAARFGQETIGFIVVAGDRHLIETTQGERDDALLDALRPHGSTTADGFVVGV